MIPGLGDDTCRLHQHTGKPESWIDGDSEVRLDPETFGAEAMPVLDAALGVAAVAAHVPFTRCAGRTRQRIGAAHDSYDRIADRKSAAFRRLLHDAEGFMAKHEPLCALGIRAIQAMENFVIGAADAERARAHKNAAVRKRGGGNV